MANIYIPDADHTQLIDALVAISPTYDEIGQRHDIIVAVGEIGGVWPESTRADAEKVATMSSNENEGDVQATFDGETLHGRWKINWAKNLITVTADDGRSRSTQYGSGPVNFIAKSLLQDIHRRGA